MLYTQTVEATTLDLIKTLMRDAEFSAFNLVGGTALSLMIGHRKSIDIDLFTDRDFDAKNLADHLLRTYKAEQIKTLKNGIFSFIGDVKVDLIAHQYPILNPLRIEDGIRMLSMEDISAMKLNAILNSGTRLKDFVDIHFLLEKLPLGTITASFIQKYPDVNIKMAHAALLYHEDINTKEKIDFLANSVSIHEMEIRFRSAIMKSSLVFKTDMERTLLDEKNNLEQKNTPKGPRL